MQKLSVAWNGVKMENEEGLIGVGRAVCVKSGPHLQIAVNAHLQRDGRLVPGDIVKVKLYRTNEKYTKNKGNQKNKLVQKKPSDPFSNVKGAEVIQDDEQRDGEANSGQVPGSDSIDTEIKATAENGQNIL